MKYFEVIIIGLLIAASLIWFWIFYRRLRLDQYGKTAARALLRMQQSEAGTSRMASPLIQKTIAKLLRPGLQNNRLLNSFCRGEILPAAERLRKGGDPATAAALEYLAGGKFNDSLPPAVKMLALFDRGDKKTALKAAEKEEFERRDYYGRGIRAYLHGWAFLEEGDLLSASAQAAAAIRLLHRAGAFFEEARAGILTGIIYRVSAMTDVAELMFRSARQIFQDLRSPKEEAEVLGHLGMLTAGADRFEEAEAYFAEAADLYRRQANLQGEAEIINQQALLALMQKQSSAAEQTAARALRLHQGLDNAAGMALSAEIAARAQLEQKQWTSAENSASAAEKLYRAENNPAGAQEAALLAARAAFENNRPQEAERKLRKIIADNQKSPSCFHVANAYSLLGIIYLRQGDLRRAKGLFQQSLDCELADERTDGVATDFANMALIEYRLGRREQGDKTAETALEYARAYGESELSALLEKTLKNIPDQA